MRINRIAITGGSGFIGTNLVQHFTDEGASVINIDRTQPRNPDHRSNWRRVDVLDTASLARTLADFSPTHIVHMAGRTDLEGRTVDEYSANTVGLSSLIEAIKSCTTVQRVVFASTMLVCRLGYIPKHDADYAPSTHYGESKAIGERLIRAAQLQHPSWIIVRPTSIWGPWFGEPYFDFFKSVINRSFVTFRGSARRTFGYVRNTVFQIAALLRAPNSEVQARTIYLGDSPGLRIDEWAESIARLAGAPPPRRVPTAAVGLAAKLGDLLKSVGIRVPMTSFRFKNMTTDNELPLASIYSIAGKPPYSTEDGIRETLRWLAEQANAK